jgi:hypothetical protein
MPSDQAASWLMKRYPITDTSYGDVFPLIKSRSWLKNDQVLLAKYYLQRIPFSSPRPYEIFSSLLPIKTFISIIKDNISDNPDDISLLLYYLKPILQDKIKDKNNIEVVELFFKELVNTPNNSIKL